MGDHLMRFRLLGPLEVHHDGRSVALGGAKVKALLATLLLAPNEVVPAHRMIDVLWGEDRPADPRSVLYAHVRRLRSAGLAHDVLTKPTGYLLRVDPQVLDLTRFDRIVSEGRERRTNGDIAGSARLLHSALALWRGPALADLDDPTRYRLGASRLEDRRLHVLEERIEADLSLGRHAALVDELEELVAARPMQERLVGQLMTALHAAGRRADAIAVYDATRRALAQELGLEPGPLLRQLHRSLLEERPPRRAPVTSAEQYSTRERRGRVPCLLPPDIEDFVGRGDESCKVRSLLDQPRSTGVPVVVISGKPGAGKTALAVRVAYQLRDRFPDGQLYVDLRGTDSRPMEPADVLVEFLRHLGVERAAMPTEAAARGGLFRGLLSGRSVLVVLDNATGHSQVRQLLPGSPQCGVIVTSRSRLSGIEGSHSIRLDVLNPSAAVQLLGQTVGGDRAAAEPEAARRIVQLCGGLPLAVRIAGARLAAKPHWPLSTLAGRLDDERRRLAELQIEDWQVRTSFEHSYLLLSAECRRGFGLLGLLPTPDFAAWAVAAVLGTGHDDAEDLAERLVDAQLLDVIAAKSSGHTRYHLHVLLRLFAQECLVTGAIATEQSEASRRLVAECLRLSRHAHQVLTSPDESMRTPAGRADAPASLANVLGADAATWFRAERGVLVAAVEQAYALQEWTTTYELALVLSGHREAHSHWWGWERIHKLGLGAAQRSGDRAAEARLLGRGGGAAR